MRDAVMGRVPSEEGLENRADRSSIVGADVVQKRRELDRQKIRLALA